jgi:2-methylcitrate dehydratase PrpD
MLHHEDPATGLEAKFSIEFCLAAVLREGDPGINEFTDEYVDDARTREVMSTVERDFVPNLFGGDFANYGARVVVELTDGTTLTAEERRAPGTPSNPISRERIEAKFEECAGAVLAAEDAAALREAIGDLDSPGAFEEFRTLVAP